MVYNELEQGGILSGIRFGLALLAYTDILLCSIWSFYKIRQTPVVVIVPRCLVLNPEGVAYGRRIHGGELSTRLDEPVLIDHCIGCRTRIHARFSILYRTPDSNGDHLAIR